MRKCFFSLKEKRLFLHSLAMPLFLTVVTTHAGRPFVTDDAGTAVREKFEAEPSVNYGNDFALAGLTFLHGLTDQADIEFTLGYSAHPENDRKLSAAGLMFKFGFIQNLLAATLGMTFGETRYCANLIASKTIGAFSGDVNLGYTTEADTNNADVTYGLDVVYTIGKLGIGAEVFGTQKMANWQIGLRITIVDWLIIDSAGGATIETSPVLQATSGLWVTF
jgi:hypothetical protein